MSVLRADEYSAGDATTLAGWVRAGDIHPIELLEAAIERAAAVNPHINAIILPEHEWARRRASSIEMDLPLRGVPFLLKDLGAHLEGWRLTNGGCRLFEGARSTHTSELVARYLRSGLTPFARTTSPEFGLTTTSASSLFGPTANPWRLDRSPGGSSGGSAAAVAAGVVPVAHGGDGGGSIRIPAAYCGLVGLKPSRGRLPYGPERGEAMGGLAVSHVLSRTVRDCALLLDATAGADVGAPTAAPDLGPGFLQAAMRPPGPLRVGLQIAAFNGAPVDAQCADAAISVGNALSGLGHDVVAVDLAFDHRMQRSIFDVLLSTSTRSALDARARELGRAWCDDDVEPLTARRARAADAFTAVDYHDAIQAMHLLGRVVAGYFNQFDVLLTPTTASPSEELEVLAPYNTDIDEFLERIVRTTAFTQPFNIAGLPAVSLPLAWTEEGLPLGVQLAAPFGCEQVLLQCAAQLEAAMPWADRYSKCFAIKGDG
jgi:amidase